MFLGIGGSWNFSKSIKFIGEYFPLINERDGSTENVGGWALGIGYYTPFIIMQLQLSNTLHLSERSLMDDVGIDPPNGNLHLGIRLSRSFNLKTNYDN